MAKSQPTVHKVSLEQDDGMIIVWYIEANNKFDALARVINAIGARDDLPKVRKVLGCQKVVQHESQI